MLLGVGGLFGTDGNADSKLVTMVNEYSLAAQSTVGWEDTSSCIINLEVVHHNITLWVR